jgi:hypothetical protein
VFFNGWGLGIAVDDSKPALPSQLLRLRNFSYFKIEASQKPQHIKGDGTMCLQGNMLQLLGFVAQTFARLTSK